jgi:two-component sensor histidine kinase
MRMEIAGEPLTLSSRAALSLAMLYQLCTNAVKHGAWSTKSGKVQITWKDDEGSFRFMWIEEGVPPLRHQVGAALAAG